MIEGAFGVFHESMVPLLKTSNVFIPIVMLAALILISMPFFDGPTEDRLQLPVWGGDRQQHLYRAMGATVDVTLRNWYMEGWFSEKRIVHIDKAVTLVVVVTLVAAITGDVL